MALRSIAYKTLTLADTNYQLTTDAVSGRVTVLNDSGAAAASANTARVFVGSSADALTDKVALPLGASKAFPGQKPSLLYGRSGTAGQILTIIIED